MSQERLQSCINWLASFSPASIINFVGTDAPTDDAATTFADDLWREGSPTGTAPEALINACYRAMQTAYLALEATNA